MYSAFWLYLSLDSVFFPDSPWLAAAFGALFVLAFFLIFWLRARYQRGRGL